jgi:hypothetical protein
MQEILARHEQESIGMCAAEAPGSFASVYLYSKLLQYVHCDMTVIRPAFQHAVNL